MTKGIGDMENTKKAGVLAVGFLFAALAFGKSPGARLTVFAPGIPGKDTMVMVIWDDLLTFKLRWNMPYRVIRSTGGNGRFEFAIDSMGDMAWFSIGMAEGFRRGVMPDPFIKRYLLQAGDDVRIDLRSGAGKAIDGTVAKAGDPKGWGHKDCRFSGAGSLKYRCRWQLDSVNASRVVPLMEASVSAADATDRFFRHESIYRAVRSAGGRVLGKFRDGLEAGVLGILEANFMAEVERDYLGLFSKPLSAYERYPEHFTAFLTERYRAIRGELYQADHAAPWYIDYLLERLAMDHWAENRRMPGLAERFQAIVDMGGSQRLRDRLLASFLFYNVGQGTGIAAFAARTAPLVGDPFCRTLLPLLAIEGVLPEGPGFDLYDRNGERVPLSCYAGKVVFIDFWYAACLPCRVYYQKVVKPVVAGMGDDDRVVFISISTDSKATFLKFMEEDFLDSRTVNLYTGSLGTAHPLVKHFNVLAYPYPVLIDRERRVVGSGSELRTIEGLKAAIMSQLD